MAAGCDAGCPSGARSWRDRASTSAMGTCAVDHETAALTAVDGSRFSDIVAGAIQGLVTANDREANCARTAGRRQATCRPSSPAWQGPAPLPNGCETGIGMDHLCIAGKYNGAMPRFAAYRPERVRHRFDLFRRMRALERPFRPLFQGAIRRRACTRDTSIRGSANGGMPWNEARVISVLGTLRPQLQQSLGVAAIATCSGVAEPTAATVGVVQVPIVPLP